MKRSNHLLATILALSLATISFADVVVSRDIKANRQEVATSEVKTTTNARGVKAKVAMARAPATVGRNARGAKVTIAPPQMITIIPAPIGVAWILF